MDREVELREFISARGVALTRAACLLTGDHRATEDLVQENYVVLALRWQKSGTVDPGAYAHRILYSRFVDGWRRRRLRELPWASPRVALQRWRELVPDAVASFEGAES